MKDRNNLMTSMIVALLAGIVYYLAGADSIEKLAPQFGLIENKTQNKNEISVIFSKADKDGGEKSFELRDEEPLKFKVKHVTKKDNKYEFEVAAEEKELASKTKEPVMKLDDAMEMLKNTETNETSLAKLNEVNFDVKDNNFEWQTNEEEVIERPTIAWTESENSHSIKSRVRTKTPKVFAKAMAAIYIGEGDIMTGKVKLHKKTNAGEDKNNTKKPAPDKKSSEPVMIDGNILYIPDVKDQPKVNNNNTQGSKNFEVNVKTTSGVSFIYVKSNDEKSGNDCKNTCKVQCNSK